MAAEQSPGGAAASSILQQLPGAEERLQRAERRRAELAAGASELDQLRPAQPNRVFVQHGELFFLTPRPAAAAELADRRRAAATEHAAAQREVEELAKRAEEWKLLPQP
eukprot:TRINITY_DN68169_c0_g1_i1.p4 TRINITY_DN68169_c0_g1~~TRINITY_DN68169_c0_g1_i1.p4  ORF type:complete len:109 (+),score=46.97 TRINITY_DN68169_c0_g1_i1:86-412(+)